MVMPKSHLIKIIDKFAPEKATELKKKEQFHWEDKSLIDKRKLRDYYFSKCKTTNSPLDLLAYKTR